MAARTKPSAGGKPDKLMRDALLLALNREAENADGRPTKKLYMIADKLVDKAMEGDVTAIREIADRVDGKPAQALDVVSLNVTGELDDIRDELLGRISRIASTREEESISRRFDA